MMYSSSDSGKMIVVAMTLVIMIVCSIVPAGTNGRRTCWALGLRGAKAGNWEAYKFCRALPPL